LTTNSPIKTRDFEDILLGRKDSLRSDAIFRAEKAIESVKNGAEACQKVKLPPCFVKNTKSTFENGEAITDTRVTWMKKGLPVAHFWDPHLEV